MSDDTSQAFNTYDIAEKGTYVCMQCGNDTEKGIITVKQGEQMPECKECGYTTWLKIS